MNHDEYIQNLTTIAKKMAVSQMAYGNPSIEFEDGVPYYVDRFEIRRSYEIKNAVLYYPDNKSTCYTADEYWNTLSEEKKEELISHAAACVNAIDCRMLIHIQDYHFDRYMEEK